MPRIVALVFVVASLAVAAPAGAVPPFSTLWKQEEIAYGFCYC